MDAARPWIGAYLATLVVFVTLDAIWLAMVALPAFQAQLGHLLRPQPMFTAALAFYAVYVLGVVVLAVRPGLVARSFGAAATHGGVLGMTAYATYDLTNLAVIQGWTVRLAALDIGWGIVVTAIAAAAGYLAGRRCDGVSIGIAPSRETPS